MAILLRQPQLYGHGVEILRHQAKLLMAILLLLPLHNKHRKRRRAQTERLGKPPLLNPPGCDKNLLTSFCIIYVDSPLSSAGTLIGNVHQTEKGYGVVSPRQVIGKYEIECTSMSRLTKKSALPCESCVQSCSYR